MCTLYKKLTTYGIIIKCCEKKIYSRSTSHVNESQNKVFQRRPVFTVKTELYTFKLK